MTFLRAFDILKLVIGSSLHTLVCDIFSSVQEKLRYTENLTKDNTNMTMVVALSYSSRWEITNAAKRIAQAVKDGKLDINDITEDVLNDNLVTNFMPDPELLIRTGGELRISNYLLLQLRK